MLPKVIPEGLLEQLDKSGIGLLSCTLASSERPMWMGHNRRRRPGEVGLWSQSLHVGKSLHVGRSQMPGDGGIA